MPNGIIPIFKEEGFTSHDVVAKLRGILKQKKIGHTGTLDPMATGVLPVCVGKATKLAAVLTDSDKEYEAVFKLGIATDTQDITGNIINTCDDLSIADSDLVKRVCDSFVGEYMQLPPMYSALKVNGQRLYDLARAGLEVNRKKRRVFINYIECLETEDFPYFSIRVGCSKGTYIRTLIHDIGERIGVYACMTKLTRTKAGGFSLNECYSLSQIQNMINQESLDYTFLKPIDAVFSTYPMLVVNNFGEKLVSNGARLFLDDMKAYVLGNNIIDEPILDKIRLYSDKKELIAIYSYDKDNRCFSSFLMCR